MNNFYVTTPIYYVNARPHIGHAYTTIFADVLKRYHSQRGLSVCLVTGTDEHGQKIVKEAEKKGVSPQKFVDQVSPTFSDLWDFLGIEYTTFIRTTDPCHIAKVKEILNILYEKDEIYWGDYEGWYCVSCESFIPKSQLEGEFCPDCKNSVEFLKEKSAFFRLSRYQEWLIDTIKKNDLIFPAVRQNEVLSFLKDPLSDLCISRPRERLSWGIPLPFDEDHVTYVWFDALINYISALSSKGTMDQLWPCDVHLIGKDILRPHAVFWPIMLKALGLKIPQKIAVHGWWTVLGEKMSKSKGNALDPYEIVKRCGQDAFRYFLLRELPFGQDGMFSFDRLFSRVNAELANNFGNFISRVLGMLHKYCESKAPLYPSSLGDAEKEIDKKYLSLLSQYDKCVQTFRFSVAIECAMEYIGLMNTYVERTAPWKMHRKNETKSLFDTLSYLLQSVGRMSNMMSPFVPKVCQKIQDHFGFFSGQENFFSVSEGTVIDQQENSFIVSEGTVIEQTEAFFPRIEE